MSRVLQTERDLYDDVWGSLSAYGTMSPGERVLPILLEQMQTPATVLDAGCGSGKTGVLLAGHGFAVTLCDLTAAGLTDEAHALPFFSTCLWTMDGTVFDYVVCCDVLEHIPPQFTMLSIERLLHVARRGVCLSVALVPDVFGAWVGKSLHQTVQPFTWWRDSISELGTVEDARDLLSNAFFYVRPR